MRRELVVGNQEGLHARPAAEFVGVVSGSRSAVTVRKNGASADAGSILEVLSLDVRQGDRITVEAEGDDAPLVLDELAILLSGERPRLLHGTGASPGVAIAPAWVYRIAEPEMPAGPINDVEDELRSLDDAAAVVADDLIDRAGRLNGDAAEILRAQATIARDPALLDDAHSAVRRGTPAASAIMRVGSDHATRIERSDDPYLAARGTDVRQICDRIARRTLGLPTPDLRNPDVPSIIVARDLTPAETATLDPRRVRGLVTEMGSRTSHTSILARSLQVPAVVAVTGILDAVATGTTLAVNGSDGVVHLDPDLERQRQLRQQEGQRRARRRHLRARFAGGAAATRDGHRIEIAANVRNIDEVQVALQAGAEGVGLFRTELFFLDRRSPPIEHEQAEVLAAMCRLLGDRRLIVRTFDIGADKPVAFLPVRPERNPELGLRGIRLAMRHPDVLDTQVRAVVRAAREGGRVGVMAPMIATVDEVDWFASRVERAGGREAGVEVGAMVEVPAAVLCAGELARRLDFLSIGTNDLTQYLHAADRRHGELADLQDPFAPAVLRAVQMTCDAAAAEGTWVGVCGEAAGDPTWAVLAVGLGVAELSMQASSILDVRATLADRTLDECREAARAALEQRGGPP